MNCKINSCPIDYKSFNRLKEKSVSTVQKMSTKIKDSDTVETLKNLVTNSKKHSDIDNLADGRTRFDTYEGRRAKEAEEDILNGTYLEKVKNDEINNPRNIEGFFKNFFK